MRSVSRSVGVGVDLGSSATTVSTRRSDDRPETRHFDRAATESADEDADAFAAAIRAARNAEEPAAVALAVPATWNPTRRLAHAEVAANAGFDGAQLVSEPEAAARYLAEVQGRELDPEAPLVVYNLGAGSCQVGVVRREGDRYRVEAAGSDDNVGGRTFDRILLDYLSRRHRLVDPEFWRRAADPAETALRASLLEEVRWAREHLTDHPSVTVSLPESGRELRLTREEAEQCLSPAVLQTVALIEDAMSEAGVESDRIAGLLLVGGASRTPLVATIIRFHLGIEPILPEMPELVLAEGAALAALAQGVAAESPAEVPPTARLQPSPGLMAAAIVLFIAITAVTGVALINGDRPGGDDLGADSVTDDTLPSHLDGTDNTSHGEPSPEEVDTGAEETSGPPATDTQDERGGDHAHTPDPTPPAPSDPATESKTPVQVAPSERQATNYGAEVPDVVDESVADARRILAEAGFTNVVLQGVRRTDTPDRQHCEVTAQRPASGTRRDYGDPITVSYVYVGYDNC